MTSPALRTLRGAMEGIEASILSTCDADGMPNASMISQVHWVDDDLSRYHISFSTRPGPTFLRRSKQACLSLIPNHTHSTDWISITSKHKVPVHCSRR